MSTKTLSLIKEHNAQWVDLRFTDTLGKEHHITFPSETFDEEALEEGRMFDGSSIHGWKGIEASDMTLLPDDSTAVMDPFATVTTVIVRCDVADPTTLSNYDRDPRSIAQRAEVYLRSTGIADTAYFGPEPEFFVFDAVTWEESMNKVGFEIHSGEGAWATKTLAEGKNSGHRPRVKGGYFPVPPVDSLVDVRTAMCDAMKAMGLGIEVHHHEVANAGQCEIGVPFNTLVKKADEVQLLKYCVHNVAHAYGKTATFMPKPLVGDNGSGMHVHQSLAKEGKNLFTGDSYGGLSELALHYIGGIIKHAHALNAFTNASTNSYKRLVKHYEAPTLIAYSARNRSASIRIPYIPNPKGRRIEVRFPDSTANPYLAFAAMMMAGLDGIQNKIHPGDPMDKDLYDLPPEEEKKIPTVCFSLQQALEALDRDRAFLKKGDVFSDDLIDGYIALKEQEIQRVQMSTHPVEFDLYYSL